MKDFEGFELLRDNVKIIVALKAAGCARNALLMWTQVHFRRHLKRIAHIWPSNAGGHFRGVTMPAHAPVRHTAPRARSTIHVGFQAIRKLQYHRRLRRHR